MGESAGLTVRSLERGLEVLRVIERRGAATPTMLHAETHLPKPTLTRLLRTLEIKGFVWRSIADGCWRLALQRHGAADMPASAHRLAAVAGPVLDDLCEIVRWPSDVSFRQRTFMQLCETSRRRAYFTLNRLEIGYRINMLLSAPGRAYLAYCPDRERAALLKKLSRDPGIGAELLGKPREFERLLDTTRQRGYAVRDPKWGGDYRRPREEFDDGLAAIAVPILGRNRVIGCVNIVWIARILTVDRIVSAHVQQLQSAAARIAELVDTESKFCLPSL